MFLGAIARAGCAADGFVMMSNYFSYELSRRSRGGA